MEADFWNTPLTTLKGIGTKVAEKLAKLQLYTLGDLLLHCPYRYEDRTRITPIQDVLVGQTVCVQGTILRAQNAKGRKKRFILTLGDKTGVLECVFFHFQLSQQKQWQPGTVLRCFGQIEMTRGVQMVHPEYEIIENESQVMAPFLTAVYPSVAGLSQKFLRRLVAGALSEYNRLFSAHNDVLAQTLTDETKMFSLVQALNTIHCPTPDIDSLALVAREHPAYARLIVEELFANHISLQHLREQVQSRLTQPLVMKEELLHTFLSNLSFELTAAQKNVWQQISTDLTQPTPMLRLVQGDVGCGKTVVAALAALCAMGANKQVAIMAPTEILAEQHFVQFNEWFSKMGYRCELLVSKLKAKPKRSVLENITLGLTHIVIGTHALFQEEVRYHDLGLIIIDEQHRFGVHQRLALQEKGEIPHQLIMTATPIPRTLAMSHYAHLDISVIDSLPPGRQPVTTLAISQSRRQEIVQRVEAVCQSNQQVYWVCTLIAESEVLQSQAAEVTHAELKSCLPHLKIGLIHGRMDPMDKEIVMQAFYRGEISILVATTVIEVGVNVPNATLMIIENPERLGLAQLHQLRGRVGRGVDKSFCVLMYQTPLSQTAQARLRIMRESNDGFVIAEADLEIRGPGEVLGTRQTGAVQFKVSDLKRDQAILAKLPNWAQQLKQVLTQKQIEQIIQRWDVGCEYGQA